MTSVVSMNIKTKSLQSLVHLSGLLNCSLCQDTPTCSKNIVVHKVTHSCPKCDQFYCKNHETCPRCRVDIVPAPALKKLVHKHKILCDIMNMMNAQKDPPETPKKDETPKKTRSSNRIVAKSIENETPKKDESASPQKSDRLSRKRTKTKEEPPIAKKTDKESENSPTVKNQPECVVMVERSILVASSEKTVEDIKPMKRRKQSKEKRNRKGETELHEACTAGNEAKVKALLKAGAPPDTRDNAGWSPLHEMVIKNAIEIVKLLLAAGALPDVPGPGRVTPLHEALKLNFVDVARILVAAGADLRAPDCTGLTPLSLADETLAADLRKIVPNRSTIDDAMKRKEIEECEIIRAYAPSLPKKQWQQLSRARPGLTFVNELTADATHLVIKLDNKICRAGKDQLLAAVSGKWIISEDWLNALKTNPNADPRLYQIAGLESVPDGVRSARINRYRQLPGLFSGCHVYFAGFRQEYEISSALKVDTKFLRKLLEMGGGTFLRRDPDPEAIPDYERTVPYHVYPGSPLSKCTHYIVYSERQTWSPNMEHMKTLPVRWLIDCVLRFRLIDPQ